MSASKDFEIGLRVVAEGYDEKSISEVIKQIEKKYSDIDLLKFNKKNLSKEKKIYAQLWQDIAKYQKQYEKASENGATQLKEIYGYVIKYLQSQVDILNQKASNVGKISSPASKKAYQEATAEKDVVELLTHAYKQNKNEISNNSKKKKEHTTTTKKLVDVQNKEINALNKSNSMLSGMKQGLLGINSAGLKFSIGMSVGREAVQLFSELCRKAKEDILNLNKAMTDVQMVTGQTGSEIYKTFDDYNKIAKELSVSTETVINGASDWLRQGKSVEETNALLKASTIQATIANLTAADSTEKLTSVLNGYQMKTEDAMHVVDALSAVDLEAATSVGELATALQKTANTARESGVDFERLVGYIAAVSENTRQAPELIGNAFRTLFARMQNVKAGKSIDEFGDSLSDVEKVLNRFDIRLRDSQYEFRNTSDVLDDISDKWETFSSVEKSQIAVAIAGTRQREIFLSLMSNYDKALKYNETALNSNGKAQEKYAIYQESINAKLQELQATFDKIVYNETYIEFFKTMLDLGMSLLNLLSSLTPIIDVFVSALDTLAVVISKVSDGFSTFFDILFSNNIEKENEKLDILKEKYSKIEETINDINSKPIKTEIDLDNIEMLKKELSEVLLEIENTNNEISRKQREKDAKSAVKSISGMYYLDTSEPMYQEAIKYARRLNGEYVELSHGIEFARDAYDKLSEAYDKISPYEDEAIVKNDKALEGIIRFGHEIEKYKSSLEDGAGTLKELQKAISENEIKYSDLSFAIAEQNALGEISAQTAAMLTNKNTALSKALTFTSDKIYLNVNALDSLTYAQEASAEEGIRAEIELTKQSIKSIQKRLSAHKIEIQSLEELYNVYRKFSGISINTGESFGDILGIGDDDLKRLENALKHIDSLENMLDGLAGTSWDKDIDDITSGIKDVGDAADDTADKIREIQDLFNAYIDAITDQIDKEIDALKNDKDYWEKYYDDKIDAIKEVQEEIDQQTEAEEKLLAIEKARANLAKANQEVVRTYVRGKGFIYQKNLEAVAAAQGELDILLKEWDNYQKKLELEQQVKNFEDAKDATINDIEEEIKKLEDLKDKWSESLDIQDAINKYDDLLDDIKKFEDMSYQERLDALEEFVNEYNRLTNKLQSGSSRPSSGSSSSKYDDDDDDSSSSSGKDWDGIVSGGGAWYNPDTYTKEEAEKKETERTGKSQAQREAGYAKGTVSAPKTSLSTVGEEGPELRIVNKGDGIIPADMTRNLMEWGKFNPMNLLSRIPGFNKDKSSQVYSFSFDKLVLPNVNDADTFVEELKTKSMRMAIQIQSQRA